LFRLKPRDGLDFNAVKDALWLKVLFVVFSRILFIPKSWFSKCAVLDSILVGNLKNNQIEPRETTCRKLYFVITGCLKWMFRLKPKDGPDLNAVKDALWLKVRLK